MTNHSTYICEIFFYINFKMFSGEMWLNFLYVLTFCFRLVLKELGFQANQHEALAETLSKTVFQSVVNKVCVLV